MKPDLYAVLGLSRAATAADVRSAYRRMAKKAHPDAGGSAEEFGRLQVAHDTLIDDERRHTYDTTGRIDDAVANPLAEVMGVVDELLMKVLNDIDAASEKDVVDLMRRAIEAEIKGIAEMLRRSPATAHKIDKLAARFHRKSGDNVLRRSLEEKAEQLRRQMAALERRRDLLKRVIAFLSEYSFDFDAPRPSFVFRVSNSTMNSATSSW